MSEQWAEILPQVPWDRASRGQWTLGKDAGGLFQRE